MLIVFLYVNMVLLYPLLSLTEATDLLQKLSLDSKPKTLEVPDATKKVS